MSRSLVDVETRMALEDFYIREAEILDERRWEEWLEFFADDIEYTAPIRVNRKSPASDISEALGHFDDTKGSLTLRVKRLRTDVAWAEDPPSLTRRLITNVRVMAVEESGELAIRTNFLLFRSRGDMGAYDLIVGQRQDILRPAGEEWVISRRRILIDQASLGTKNLAVFL